MPEKLSTTTPRTASMEGVSHIDLTSMSKVDHGRMMTVDGRKTGGVFVKKAETEQMGSTYVHSDEARQALEDEGYSSDEVAQAIDSARASGVSLALEDLPSRYGHDRKVTVHSANEKIGGGSKFLGKEGLIELPNGAYVDLELVQKALLAPVPHGSAVEAQRAPRTGEKDRRLLRGLAAAVALALAMTMASSTATSEPPEHDEPVAAAPAFDPPHEHIITEAEPADHTPSEAVEQAPEETPGWVVEPGGGIISELEDELGMSNAEATAAWIAIQPGLKQAVAEGKIPADFFYEENGNLRINKAGPVPRDVQTVIEGLLGL